MSEEAESMGEKKPRDIVERSFCFAVEVVRCCRELDRKPGVERMLTRQLIKSGTSIGANVEEAQAGQSRADFVNKYAIALKEARETVYWLRLFRESGIGKQPQVDKLQHEAEQLCKIIAAIIVSAKKGKEPK